MFKNMCGGHKSLSKRVIYPCLFLKIQYKYCNCACCRLHLHYTGQYCFLHGNITDQ